MYIRTKNKIYQAESETCDKQGYYIEGYEYDVILKKQVIKEAYTIEELCDEFVLKTTNKESGKSYYGLYYYSDIKHFKVKEGYKGVWYGAIWASKGLIYVAKLNDKGELELI